MQTRRTLIFSLLFVLLGLSLMLSSPREVNAGTLTTAEWEAVAGYIDSYIQSQHTLGPDTLGLGDGDNEYGFLYTPALYKSRVDTNSDGTVCGVGDDMANRPVLVDNLIGTGTLVPGTSLRNQWNGTSLTTGGLSVAVVTALRNKVIAHREAGFSDAISVY